MTRWHDSREDEFQRYYINKNGKRQPFGLLCKDKGIHRDTVRDRLKRGWSLEEALSIPPGGARDK